MDFGKLLAGAVENPGQRADAGELSQIMTAIGALTAPAAGGQPDAVSGDLLSTVGGLVRNALQQRRQAEGPEAVQQVVGAHAGMSPDPGAVDAVFPGGAAQGAAEAVAQRTGLDLASVMRLLPVVVPMVLKLLQGGAPAPDTPPTAGTPANPLLSAFLDADRDGDVDLGDAMGALGRFMGR